jgi:hypothetical protein
MSQCDRRSPGRMATKGYPKPIDVYVSNAARLHQTTVPDVDELTRSLAGVLDSTSYTIHADPQFGGSLTPRAAKQHELGRHKNVQRRGRDLSWVLVAYLVGVAGLLSAAAYRLLS